MYWISARALYTGFCNDFCEYSGKTEAPNRGLSVGAVVQQGEGDFVTVGKIIAASHEAYQVSQGHEGLRGGGAFVVTRKPETVPLVATSPDPCIAKQSLGSYNLD